MANDDKTTGAYNPQQVVIRSFRTILDTLYPLGPEDRARILNATAIMLDIKVGHESD